jgi:hypothetical protein
MGAHLLHYHGGPTIVTAAGAIVLVILIVLVFYGLSSKFIEAIRSKTSAENKSLSYMLFPIPGILQEV